MTSERCSPSARRPTPLARDQSSSGESTSISQPKASGPNIQLFTKSRDVEINQSTFTVIGGNQINNHYQPRIIEQRGLTTLLANITCSAFHDAAERGDPPRCHPETQTAIIDEIMQWINLNPQARERFITWLNGPAGGGKTAILQSIAEACVEKGLLAASFFFGRLSSGRNTLTHIIATLAYQLAKSIPEIEDCLLTVIEKDSTIFSRSLSSQMQRLIIGPLTSVPLTSRPRLVIIDGVDECGPHDQAHKELLGVLGAAMDELKNIPIIFLIGSRPEFEIRTAFKNDPLKSLTNSLVLDDKYNPDQDIRTYLQSKFRTIRQERSLTDPWPAESDVDILVDKASGQFIFASTIIKFIDSARHSARKRLKVILNLTPPGMDAPFSELDALYRFILSSVEDVEHVLQILTWITLGESAVTRYGMTLYRIQSLLNLDDIHATLVDMHGLIKVPQDLDQSLPLQVYHASFHDFLMDSSRSGDYHIDTIRGHIFLSQRWIDVLSRYKGFDTQFDNCLYAALTGFAYHCNKLPPGHGGPLVNDLASFNLKRVLASTTRWSELYTSQWQDFLDSVQHQGLISGPKFSLFSLTENLDDRDDSELRWGIQ